MSLGPHLHILHQLGTISKSTIVTLMKEWAEVLHSKNNFRCNTPPLPPPPKSMSSFHSHLLQNFDKPNRTLAEELWSFQMNTLNFICPIIGQMNTTINYYWFIKKISNPRIKSILYSEKIILLLNLNWKLLYLDNLTTLSSITLLILFVELTRIMNDEPCHLGSIVWWGRVGSWLFLHHIGRVQLISSLTICRPGFV